MPFKFPSDAWVKAFMDKLNASPAYAETAKNWEGDICFVVGADGDALPAPVALYLDLWHGRCRQARQLAHAAEQQAAFVLHGSLGAYARIINGELDPIQAMLTRQLKVTGSMITLMRNVPTVLEFVRTAAQVETEFPQ
jgi:putative sterol carrier protein